MSKSEHKINSFQLTATHFLNELKAVFGDKGALLILIGAMIIYPVIYSIGYFNETMNNLSVGVVDLDHSAASRKYESMIDASAELNVTCKPENLALAEALFMDNKINGVVLIPKGFQEDLLLGKQAQVAIYADAGYFLKYKNTVMAVTVSNAWFSGGVAVKHYLAEGKSLQQAKIAADPLAAQTHILYNPSAAYGSFVMPGMILIIIQQTLLIGIGVLGGSFSESKDSPFLLSGQQRKRDVIPLLMGKTGAYLLISLLNIAFAVVMVHHWFNYPDKASMLHILMLLFPYILSVIFLGIGLSTLFKHRESSMVFMVFLSPVALFLSGLSWPVSAIPDWLVTLSKLMPSTTAVPAYLRLRNMGVGIAEVKDEMIFMYAQAAVYFMLTLSYFLIRISVDKRRNKVEVEIEENNEIIIKGTPSF